MTENVLKTKETKEEFPEKWKDIPILDYFGKGFKPKQKPVGNHTYITLKRGRFEKSLGRFSEDRWALINKMFNENVDEPPGTDEYLKRVPELSSGLKAPKSIMGVKIKRPVVIPTSFTPELDTIYYFQLLKFNGYDGTFERFLNEIVRLFFEKGCGYEDECQYRNHVSPGLIIETIGDEKKL